MIEQVDVENGKATTRVPRISVPDTVINVGEIPNSAASSGGPWIMVVVDRGAFLFNKRHGLIRRIALPDARFSRITWSPSGAVACLTTHQVKYDKDSKGFLLPRDLGSLAFYDPRSQRLLLPRVL